MVSSPRHGVASRSVVLVVALLVVVTGASYFALSPSNPTSSTMVSSTAPAASSSSTLDTRSSSSSGATTTSASSSTSQSTLSSPSSTRTTTSSSTFPPLATLTTIEIPAGVGSDRSLNYKPAVIRVTIGVNNTILWVQHDPGSAHTVTSASTPAGASPFDSGDLTQGQNFVQNLTVQGTY